MDSKATMRWFDPLTTTSEMRCIFSDWGRLQGILDFEAALARAEARAGLIPLSAAVAIEGKCSAELFDFDALAIAAASAGNSAIPIVNALTALVSQSDPDAARYVHWGATSQDAMDTGLVLQFRDALNIIEVDCIQLCDALAELAATHKHTILAGRTWLQHASPITLGLKVVGWLSAILRHIERMRAMRHRVQALQFGGSVGTLSSIGEHGFRVASHLADELQLGLPDLAWHAHRDRLVEVAAAMGMVVGTLGKMARDISLMSQTEVGEVAESPDSGRGGSSSMPHKQNPIGCATILGTSLRLPGLVSTMFSSMAQEHERGLGGWQAEWDTLPEIFTLASGAVAHMNQVVRGLVVDTKRMETNLDATHGFINAEAVAAWLANRMGRSMAHTLVERACRQAVKQGCHLRDVLAADPEIATHWSLQELEKLFDPEAQVHFSSVQVDRVLATYAQFIQTLPLKSGKE